jgi:hypothetical protein
MKQPQPCRRLGNRKSSCHAAPVPARSPEVEQARRRNVWLTFASTPLILVLLWSRRSFSIAQHLATGEVCDGVLGPSPLHPSVACKDWRHYQLVRFIWPASALFLAIAATVSVKSVRSEIYSDFVPELPEEQVPDMPQVFKCP